MIDKPNGLRINIHSQVKSFYSFDNNLIQCDQLFP